MIPESIRGFSFGNNAPIAALATIAITLMLLIPGVIGDEPNDANGSNPTTPIAPNERAEYVGSKRCKMCHKGHYDAWAESKKGRSWEALESGKRLEAKVAVNLDPGKDYTTDALCLRCHSIGFGKPTGYAIPDPEDGKAVRRVRHLQGAGCESCHGPGGAFTKVMRQIKYTERNYHVSELRAAGLRAVTAKTCITCHDPSAPCIAAADTEAIRRIEKWTQDPHSPSANGAHKSFPLKYRSDEKQD